MNVVNNRRQLFQNQLLLAASIAQSVVKTLIESVVVPVKSVLTHEFGKSFKNLPPQVQTVVHEKYHRWRKDPASLKFEPKFSHYYVVEINRSYHAVATVVSGVVTWLTVGDYGFYTRYLDVRRK